MRQPHAEHLPASEPVIRAVADAVRLRKVVRHAALGCSSGVGSWWADAGVLPAVPHPRYLEFARHYGFAIKVCGPRKPHEKGRAEKAVH